MPKIVLLKSNIAARGGLEKYTFYLASAFAKHHCETLILTNGAPLQGGIDLDPKVKIVSLGCQKTLSLSNLISFKKESFAWLKTHPQDLIFGMDRTCYQTHYRAGNGVHAAYLKQRTLQEKYWKQLTFKFNPLHLTTLKYEKKAFESPFLKKLFTNSYFVKNQILEHYCIPSEKICTIHNGVEWSELQKPFDQWEELSHPIRTKLGLDKASFQLLFVGHGYRRKGLLELLRGLSLVKNLQFQLSVIGKDKELRFFQMEAQKLGLSKRVFFFGAQTNLHPFYQMADALVIPSIYDPFANVTVEALAMGLYVITSKFNGGCEILSKNCGSIVENIFNPESMSEAILEVSNRPKTILGAQEIRNSIKHLDFSNQLSQLVYQTLMDYKADAS